MTIVTLEQLDTAANASLDYHLDKGKVFWQNEQERPLLRDLMSASKTYAGGQGLLTERVAGEYATGIEGFEYDDEVGYTNPGKLRTASYPWKFIHGGINVTNQELLENGISVSNSANGTGIRKLSDRDSIVLADVFEYKMEDMKGGMAKDMDEMLWDDGSADAKLVPGIRSLILDDPTTGVTVGGIDQAANSWWRNYANVSIDAATAANQNTVKALQAGFRQMRRYGTPKLKGYAGSDFLTAYENEMRALGNYTQTGWADSGRIDASMGDAAFKKVSIDYAPTLDDLGLQKYCYFIDTNAIRLRVIEGEDMKQHTPNRPHNKYVLYRAITWAGGLTARRRNTSGVFAIQ